MKAAKGILHVKKLPYVKVRQELGGDNRALLDWTVAGERSRDGLE